MYNGSKAASSGAKHNLPARMSKKVMTEEIPRGKLSGGYFGPIMVSLLGTSAVGPTRYERAGIQRLLINAVTLYSTHTLRKQICYPLGLLL